MCQEYPPEEEDFLDEDPPEPTWWQRICDEFAWLMRFLKRWTLRLVILALHLLVISAGCYFLIWFKTRKLCYSSVKDVPARTCGLVLGCVKEVNGYQNIFFNERVNAAAELFHADKVQYLIVSGDNSNHGYNEPADLKSALIAKGVPAARIYCDYAGFRTLDSVIRARKVFGQREVTIISQKFHNERALYFALKNDLGGSIGYNAKDASEEKMLKIYAREVGARIRALADLFLFETQPKFLGDKIPIGPLSPPVDAPASTR